MSPGGLRRAQWTPCRLGGNLVHWSKRDRKGEHAMLYTCDYARLRPRTRASARGPQPARLRKAELPGERGAAV